MNGLLTPIAAYWWLWLILLVCSFGYSVSIGPSFSTMAKQKGTQLRNMTLREVQKLAKEDAIKEAKSIKRSSITTWVGRTYLASLVLFPLSLILRAVGY